MDPDAVAGIFIVACSVAMLAVAILRELVAARASGLTLTIEGESEIIDLGQPNHHLSQPRHLTTTGDTNVR